MRKLRERWAKIPRPLRAISNIALVILLLYLLWCSSGKPLHNDYLEYRRMEKMQMLGPGTIVHEMRPHYGTEEYPADHYGEFEHTILSETYEGIIFFGTNTYSDGEKYYTMTYQEKAGDITLAVPPTDWMGWGGQQWDLYLPIFVFHEYPEAVRAEMDLTIEGVWEINYSSPYIDEQHKEPYVRTYSLQSSHKTDDFFLFSIFVENIFEEAQSIEYLLRTNPEKTWETMHGPDGAAPQLLSALWNNGPFYNDKTGTAQVAIRLYDENDHLIAETEIFKQAPAPEAAQVQEVQTDEN